MRENEKDRCRVDEVANRPRSRRTVMASLSSAWSTPPVRIDKAFHFWPVPPVQTALKLCDRGRKRTGCSEGAEALDRLGETQQHYDPGGAEPTCDSRSTRSVLYESTA